MSSVIRNFNPYLGEKEEVVQEYKPLVHSTARRFRWAIGNVGIDYDDLVGEAWVGLFKAYQRFDPIKFEGKPFAHYAAPMMRGEIQRFLLEKGTVVKVSKQLYAIAGRIIRNDFLRMSAFEISNQLGCTPKEANEALKYLGDCQVLSIDKPIHPNGNEAIDLTLSDTIQTGDDLSSIDVRDFAASLTDRERHCLKLRLHGHTIFDIQMELECTEDEVYQLLEILAAKYRAFMNIAESEVLQLNKKLTKAKYLELKQQELSDDHIRSMYGLGKSSIYRLKRQWEIIQQKGGDWRSQRQTLLTKSGMAEPASTREDSLSTPVEQPVAKMTVLDDRLQELHLRLEQMEHENMLLKSLLKTYL